jgi:RNA polymerase sigma-70 factor, ECF subfamily
MTNPLAAHTDRLQFERSVLPLTQGLRRSALRLARSSADADDLVQETVLRAWRSWPRYTERATCRAWLHRILRNTFVTRYRLERRRREVLALPALRLEQEAALSQAQPREAQGGMDDALALGLGTLREDQRRVLWLVDVQRCSYQDAADALGIPIGTVMSRLHRARGTLRGQLTAALATGRACLTPVG